MKAKSYELFINWKDLYHVQLIELFSIANRKISLSIFLGFFAATCKTF